MKYFFYGPKGEITRVGETNNLDSKMQLLVGGEKLAVGGADPNSQYYDNGLIDIPPPPGKNYVFNYDNKLWEPDIAAAKEIHIVSTNDKYLAICNGKDPVTGKQIYVDCVVGETTYRMNAGKEAAKSMDEGVRIYERAGATHMPVVRDFYNTNHENIPLDEAISISLQQGADALTYWQRKGELVDQINAATTVEEVQAIEISFTVNTE